jgi:hypothetical protein
LTQYSENEDSRVAIDGRALNSIPN